MKYGKEFPQIYATKVIEDGYYIARSSYYGSAEIDVSVSFYVNAQLLSCTWLHITIKRLVFPGNPDKIWRIIVMY